ncbi:MAG: peptidylprolyl isomerase [Oscillospiraceae bacterium]|nr:peptidylprolyl isomerase [Oscillospiraceae bacterium]
MRLSLLFLLLFICASCHGTNMPSDDQWEATAGERLPGSLPLLTIDKIPISDPEVNYVISRTIENEIQENPELASGAPDRDDWDYILKKTLEAITSSRILDNNAKKLGYGLDGAQEREIDEFIQWEIQEAGGRDAFDVMIDSMGGSMELFRFYEYTVPILQQKLIESLFQPGAPYAPDSSTLGELYEQAFTNASYILIQNRDNEWNLLSGGQLERQRAIAQVLRDRAIAGEDFASLIVEYGCDAEMNDNPGGFPIPRGHLGSNFDKALAALEEGEISPVVESDDGFYIIKRHPPDAEWGKENIEIIEALYAEETYESLLGEWHENAAIAVNDEFWAIDAGSYAPVG